MPNNNQDKNPNVKIGLIFVQSKISDQECIQQNLSPPDIASGLKKHNQWIVVAGNSYNIGRNQNTQVGKNVLSFVPQQDNEVEKDDLLQNDLPVEKEYHQDLDVLSASWCFYFQPFLLLNIVEIHLDSVFKEKRKPLCPELFKCENVQVLSLRRNNIVSLPAEIGRLRRLHTLVLTDNSLTEDTIPHTLTFCKDLRELYLDNNLLDALPGFLLQMTNLQTVYRHGNLNYFKSTFMWYHTSERDRVMPLGPSRPNAKLDGLQYEPESLMSHAVRALVASKINFFIPGLLPVTLQSYVSRACSDYKICAYCSEAFAKTSKPGFRVFTFKNPYLGNTCVPFEHWTCSRECGVSLAEPAHRLEQAHSLRLEELYQQYIKSVQKTPKKITKKVPSKCSLM